MGVRLNSLCTAPELPTDVLVHRKQLGTQQGMSGFMNAFFSRNDISTVGLKKGINPFACSVPKSGQNGEKFHTGMDIWW